jgi:hypothetical protein
MRLRSAGETLRAHLPQRLRWEPWSVLVPLVLLQWLVVAYIAHRATHNGWLYYHNPSATRVYTTAWILGGGHLPLPYVGYGLPLLLAPVTWIAGANGLAALHIILAVQVLLLLPLAVVGMYVLGARSGGRLLGYASAAVWTLMPLASLHYFPGRNWIDQTLPTTLGLTELQYFPSLLAVALAAVLVLRTLDEPRLVSAAAAGVAAGLAVAIEPTNVVFLAAPLVAFAAARRLRELGAFVAALAPCLLAYLLWRERGGGHIGTLSQLLLLPGPTRYHFSWSYTLHVRFIQLQTTSWSPRLLEWIALAGVVALLKRSPVRALFFGTWVLAYILLGGGFRAYDGDNVAFWHVWMPAFPAFCVLLASLPLLWPGGDRRFALPFPYRPRVLVPLAAPALLGIILPLVVVAALPVLHSAHVAAEVRTTHEVVPLDRGPRATAAVSNGRVSLSWTTVGAPTHVTYTVYRTPVPVHCSDPRGATRCVFEMARLATTSGTTFSERPPKGVFSYRIALTANYLQNKRPGSTILIGPPVTVRTP